MKRYLIISFLFSIVFMTPGWAEAEEAGCYQSADNWIIRVYSGGVISPYSLSLAVMDTNGAIVPASQIDGLKTL